MNRYAAAAAVCLIMCASIMHAEQITFYADTMTGTAGNKSDTTTLSGNAFVKTQTMEITADSIELSGDDFRFIIAEGNITAKNTETNMDFTCGKLKYDRQTKIATLQNSVHFIDKKNNVTADAQIVEYSQDSETAVLQVGITLKQKNNVCTGAYAIYHKKIQKLELSGNPKIVQGEDTFRAQEIDLDLNSQEIELDGRVSGTVTNSKTSKDKEDTSQTGSGNTDTTGISAQDGSSASAPSDDGNKGAPESSSPQAGSASEPAAESAQGQETTDGSAE